MGSDQSAHPALFSNCHVDLKILGSNPYVVVGESKLCFLCHGALVNLILYRAYVEELEERVKRMDEQLQMLSRNTKSSQQNVEESQTSGPTEDINRIPGGYNPESLEEGNTSATASSPDNEASSSDQDTSDQSSYVLRAQDGKMRFFGWFFLFLFLNVLLPLGPTS